ncbi:MAG: hypothetical protein HOE90_24565 [Bacteriovoracaceae bacterium]|nr:hypothetical protein [Bacteriovoracaceae bacterium]
MRILILSICLFTSILGHSYEEQINTAPIIVPKDDYAGKGISVQETCSAKNIIFKLDEGINSWEDKYDSLIISIKSSNAMLLPVSNIVTTTYDMITEMWGDQSPMYWGDDLEDSNARGKNLNLTLMPVFGKVGKTTITIEVDDGWWHGVTSYSFDLTVTPMTFPPGLPECSEMR